MKTWVCLLRGINVGGRNIVPMKSLVETLVSLECRNVSTYIQSGNIVFQHESGSRGTLQPSIEDAIERDFAIRPLVHLQTAESLDDVVDGNPFPTDDPKSLHVFFLAERADSPDLAAMDELRAATEAYEVADNAVYLHAPNGIGRSKLAARIEKLMGVAATARNWRTVTKLVELVANHDA